MKKILSVLAVFAVGALAVGVGSASAFSLGGYVGPVEFKLTGLTESLDLGPYNQPPPGTLGTGETWGVFKVTTIQSADGMATMLWQQNQDDEQIYGMFYGLYDWKVVPNAAGTAFEISQLGGFFDMYISTGNPLGDHTAEYNVALGPVAGRTAINGYNTITNIVGAQTFLSGNFSPGVVPGDPITTIKQNVDSATSPATGSGSGYADLTGGIAQSIFDTNGLLLGHDMHLEFDVKVGAAFGWDQVIQDPVQGNAVPVPPTMFLLGTGLAGLAGLRRKYNL